MKILKYVLGALALLIVGMAAVVMMSSNTLEYGNELEVNKPLKESWAVFMDENKMDQWLPFIKNQELVSGEAGKTGAVTKMTIDNEGTEMEMMETLISVKENDHMTMKFEADGMTQELNMSFAEKDGKTVMKSKSTMETSSFMMKAMITFMGSAFKDSDMVVMEALKKTIEENTTDYFPAPVLISEDATSDEAVTDDAEDSNN